MSRATPRRILIIKPSSLGDIVHALPVLAGLRAAHPHAHLAWLVAQPFAALLAGHPLLDEVIVFDRRRFGRMAVSARALLDFVRFLRGLRARRFDLVIDLQGLVRSGFLALATGAKRRIGFADARELAPLFYTRRVRVQPHSRATQNGTALAPGRGRGGRGTRTDRRWRPGPDVHAVDRNLAVARALDLPVEEPTFPLALERDEIETMRLHLVRAAGHPLPHFVALLPGARWESKCWRPAQFAALLDQMHAAGLPTAVLLGAPDEAPLAGEILRLARVPAVNLVGKTSLRELGAALALADVVICHDSGPMHIAAALNRPLVAVFGPTNPARTGPYSPAARVVQRDLPCVPCYRRRCPLGHHACLEGLEPQAVLAQVREIAAGVGAVGR